MHTSRNRLKNAELLSLLGACIASAGIAVLARAWLEPFWLLLILVGIAVHAAAMFYRRRLEASAGMELSRWERGLYRACWIILCLLVISVLAMAIRLPPA